MHDVESEYQRLPVSVVVKTCCQCYIQGCRVYGYPWINPCVDIRLRLHYGYIHGYF